MVLGEDMGLEEVEILFGKVLTCKFIGKIIRKEFFIRWMENNWKEALNYIPKFHFLI
jgi:hypothetical protein